MTIAALPPDLAPTVARLRLLAEAAFLARLNSGSGFGDVAAPTQIHLHDRAASARLGRAAMRPSETHRKALAEVEAALAAADAELLRGDPAGAFARLVTLVRDTSGDDRDAVRARLLELFEVVGPDHPDVAPARVALANALF